MHLIFIGIDWSEQHHEVEVQAGSGKVLKRLRVDADMAGLSRLREVITDAAEEPSQVVIWDRVRPRSVGRGSGRQRLPRLSDQSCDLGPGPRGRIAVEIEVGSG